MAEPLSSSRSDRESHFEPLEPRTIKTQVATRIRSAILDGTLRPGDHIPEAAIAEQLGVSRAPIREALNQLEKQGLIVMKPHRGAFIRDLDPSDIQDTLALRSELEGYLGELLIERGVSSELLEDLRSHMAAMERAARNDDFLELVEHDAAFHGAMLEAAENGPLSEVMQGIGFRVRTFMVVTKLISKSLLDAARDHEHIIRVLEEGDRPRVRQVMRDHVRHYMEMLELEHAKEPDGS